MAMQVKIRVRSGTSEEWAAKDPVLLLAEPGYDSTTRTLKIGDGASKWSELPVTVTTDQIDAAVANSVSVNDGILAAVEAAAAPALTASQQAAAAADASRDLAENAVLSGGALPVRYTNLLTDPTYQVFGTAGWSFLGGTAVRSGADAVVTGNGTIGGIGLYSSAGQAFVGKAGHRYYVRAEMAIPTTSANDATLLSVSLSDNSTHQYVGGFQTAVASPAKNLKYTISGVVELPADYDGKSIRLYQRAYFTSPAAANGSQVRLHPAVVFDLTEASPTMPEPTKEVLDREVAASAAAAPVTELRRRPTAILERTFAPKTKRSVAAGPHVVLRFDDGFRNNLTVAAPILGRYGYPGVIYHCTGAPSLSGAAAQHPLMTPDEVRRLWDTYGWEVAAHTRNHEDAINTPIADWRASIRGNALDLVGMGLPRPVSMAYPNGSRSKESDRLVYGLFDKCGLTGGPERIPWPYNKGTFFTGWCALGGPTDADARLALAKVKRYIAASFDKGCVPVVGIHGTTVEQTTWPHFLRADLLADLCQWLWAEGYPVSTMSDTPRHNMVTDPRFTTQDITTPVLGGHPWYTYTTGGWARYADVNAFSGYCARLNATSGLAVGNRPLVEQRINVEPETAYKVYLHHCSPSHTSGAVVARVSYLDVLGNPVGTPTPSAASISSAGGSEGAWVGGTPFTTPPGAYIAVLSLLPDATTGVTGDIRVDSVAMFPASTYDPLAP